MRAAVITSIFLWAFLFLLLDLLHAETLTVFIDRSRYMRRSVAANVASLSIHSQPIPLSYRIKTSPRNRCYSLPETLQLSCYKTLRRGITHRVLFLAQPLIIDGIIYTAGRANVCIPWGTGVCNVTERNQANVDRISWGVAACTHELGHLLGARHDNNMYGGCPSIMHEAPLPFVGACPLAFSDRSKNQILACMNRR